MVVKEYRFLPFRVEHECSAEIDCIEVVKDGDHLLLIMDLNESQPYSIVGH